MVRAPRSESETRRCARPRIDDPHIITVREDPSMDREFEGRVAFVTGAGHGIARQTSLMFATRGADLGLTDSNEAELAEVARECETAGAIVVALPVDLSSSASVDAVVRAVHERLGRIDVAAHVAGIYPSARIEEATDEHWATVIGTNLTGTFHCCRAVLPIMRAGGRGSIVNVASGAGFRGIAGLGAYGASKAGIVGLSRALAIEAAPVRVNVVSPGPTSRTARSEEPDEPAGTGVGRHTGAAVGDVPIARTAYPEEIAEAICWLASDRASFVTGQVLHVDGGRFMP
jgi:NAD(P)-dependent dehydrogenase (short-subunit alcohol dehydrogenase family)